jgi:2,5-dihydroxypyridine 5,6-dioxygenase
MSSIGTGPIAELTNLARAELELCRVSTDETVVVFSDTSAKPELAAALLGAASGLGSRAALVTLPSIEAPVGGGAGTQRAGIDGPLLELTKQADLVIDATRRGFLHSTIQRDITASGTRVLRVREPADVLARLFPTSETMRIVERSADILDAGDRLDLQSEEGTKITIRKGRRSVQAQYGFTADRGRGDHWGTSLVAVAPLEAEAEGVLVLAPQDIVFLSATVGVYVTERLVLRVEGGAIVAIEGGRERGLLEGLLGGANAVAARRISHVGWGCDARADWTALERYRGLDGGGADVRSLLGGVVVAFGANSDMGGENVTTVHVDLAFRNTSFSVDGEEIVDRERLTFLEPEIARA